MSKRSYITGTRDEATDPETSPEWLAELAKNKHLAPLVATNPNTPVEALLALAAEHPREFLSNPVLPLLHLEDPRQFAQIAPLGALVVLRLADVPGWLSSAWSQHSNENVSDAARLHIGQIDDPSSGSGPADAESALRYAPLHIIKNDGFNFSSLQLPDWVVLCLSQHRDSEVRNAIVGSNISATLLVQFAKQQDLRRAVAGNANTLPDILRQLSHDADSSVREAVARNPHTTGDILKNLARSQASQIRAAVAANVHTPVDALTLLADDNDLQVRAGVAGNPNTPAAALTTLGHDKQWNIRLAVAQNPGTPANVLRRLFNDREERVSREAQTTLVKLRRKKSHQAPQPLTAQQRYQQITRELSKDIPKNRYMCYLKYLLILAYADLPAEILAKQAESLLWAERYIIARHPNAGHFTLKRLAQDGNRFVRVAAQERLATDDGGSRHE